MKAREAMEMLNITRPTLCSYVQKGWINAVKLPNGQYDYDSDSVRNFNKKVIKSENTIATVPEVNPTDVVDIRNVAIQECLKNSLNLFKYLKACNLLPAEAVPYLTNLEKSYKDLKNIR